ncbi:hypothetical protein DYB32_004862 [Aphanomyces invadans]|uniref:E3 ubiquitin-protein ligase n=1 Tax=Aphanomyces invadans TaxID=157072 RepID=A0A418AW85_9STRA|nr:hypothetical protein DYB32_004862 [Aphanomyces invadans]
MAAMMEQDAAVEVAEFAQLWFLEQVNSSLVSSNTLLRGLDIMMTCLVDPGGKPKKHAAVTKKDKDEFLVALGKPRDVLSNPVFARMLAKKRRKVCGYIFKADEVAYSCRDCQHDSTCVMCQACFADSKHDGHDVSFQRTSAGGCCDCGDPEAWAKSGFCTKHPGREDTSTSTTASKLDDLPRELSFVAGSLIDAVVHHLFDVLATSEQGLRVAEGMAYLGSRVSDDVKKQWKVAAATREKSLDGQNGVFDTRLHSDDINPFSDVVQALRTNIGLSKLEAITFANKSDAEGYTDICPSTLVRATAIVVSMENYTTSVVPHAQYDVRRVAPLIEWLRSLCEISDGLAALVSRSIAQRRVHPTHAAKALSSKLVEATSLKSKNGIGNLSIDQCLKRWRVSRDAVMFASIALTTTRELSEWACAVPTFQANSMAWGTLLPGCLGNALEAIARAYPDITAACKATAEAFAVPCTVASKPAPSFLDILVRNYCLLTKSAIYQVNLFTHELILNQSMKHAMMDAFVDGYAQNTATYLKGLGATSDSIFDFATQLLTVPSLLAKYPTTLVSTLLDALATVLNTSMGTRAKANGQTCPEFRSDSIAISHSKYKFADAQVRRRRDEPHVEYESDSWFATFNLGIKLHALFPLVLHSLTSTSTGAGGAVLLRRVMHAINQVKDSTLSVMEKTTRALVGDALFDATESSVLVLDRQVPREASTLHIPLHRFVSAMLKQVLVLSKDESTSSMDTWREWFGLDSLSTTDVVLLLDAPLQCLAMSSQIQANLWRRNGDENMVTQLFNYCAMPYCIGVLLLGPEHVVALIVDRFGLRSYFADPDDAAVSPTATYDKQQELQMVDEVLRLVLVLSTNVPSTTGSDHEDAFLREELVHQLLIRPSTFSELSDNVSLPLGGQDIAAPIARLEPLLEQVASFQPPAGLEPGKYTIKTDSIAQCNPYHMHLNRELHEVAREKILERPNASPPFVPPSTPLPHLANVQSILVTPSTIEMVKCVLRRRCNKENSRWSEALVSTALDVLVYGAQVSDALASTDEKPSYWDIVTPLIEYLVELERSDDKEHRHVVSWLLNEYPRRAAVCATALAAYTCASNTGKDGHVGTSAEMDLEARKKEAKARAMAAMAKQMAAFSQLMDEDTEDDDDMGVDKTPHPPAQAVKDNAVECKRKPSSGPHATNKKRARKTSMEENFAPTPDTKVPNKKWKPTCMLCHDSKSNDELCMVAMVQQSTVLSTGFRPTAADALHPEKGPNARASVTSLIRAMQLQSRGDFNRSSPFHSPPQHRHHDHHHHHDNSDEDSGDDGDESPRMAFADLFWDMEHDDEFDDHHHDHVDGNIELAPHDDFRDQRNRADSHDNEARAAADDDMTRMLGGALEHAIRMMPQRRARRFRFNVRRHARPPVAVDRDDDGLDLVPVGLFVRTCQHIVHMKCVDKYMETLHEKAARGEEFDGMQAVDGDAPMTQFLCPMCKGLCNVLIPMIPPTAPVEPPATAVSPTWFDIVQRPDNSSWIRPVHQTHSDHDKLKTWKEYYEDALWEPHGSFEMGAPYLWSACAYTVAATLAEADAVRVDSGESTWPTSLEKEYASMQALVTFTRWSFGMVRLTGESKVIYETVKRCCPVVQQSKREYKKYTKAFVVSMVAADSIETIGELIPVFCAADMLQRVGRAFFVSEPQREASFYQDVPVGSNANEAMTTGAAARMQTRRGGHARVTSATPTDATAAHAKSLKSLQRYVFKATRHGKHAANEPQAVGAVELVLRLCGMDPTLRLKADVDVAVVNSIVELNALLVRRMHIVYGCLTDKSLALPIRPPSFRDVSRVPLNTLQTIWEWCVIRKASQHELGAASQDATNRCEHAEYTSEAYLANMFILRDKNATSLDLVALPTQYDDLYSHNVRLKCRRCDRVPREPGLCLVCGTLLCCGESCCAYSHVRGNPPMGECTRHAFECGGGLGAVLMLQQCRVLLVAGSMVAYFPSPYVDSHGEEDPGLQRGRPLKLDTNRYNMLQSLWRSHRLYGEVSRLRNQRDNQQPLNLTYI